MDTPDAWRKGLDGESLGAILRARTAAKLFLARSGVYLADLPARLAESEFEGDEAD